MNFLAIIRSRPLSGLLCLIFSIASFIWLKLDAINDYELNPFIVIIIAISAGGASAMLHMGLTMCGCPLGINSCAQSKGINIKFK